MSMTFYNDFFTGVGVDVSDHHVRIVVMTVLGSVGKRIEIELPEGIVVDERVLQPENLKTTVNERLKKEHIVDGALRTTLLVPESRVFASSMLLSPGRQWEDVQLQARDRAQKEIPIPFDKAIVAVSRGRKVDGQTRTTVYAMEQEVAKGLTSSFDPAHFYVMAMEANSKALLRLFQRYGTAKIQVKDPHTLIGLVDIGHSWATISIYAPDGSNLFSRTLSYQASTDKTGDRRLSQGTVDDIRRTIDEVVLYFQEKKLKIGLFLFAGVEAEDDRFKSADHFYQMGDVVSVSGLKKREIHTFGAAIGAAMRSVRPFSYHHQHNFISPIL